MAEDDYDLMPHAEIARLKNEVTELRNALAGKKGVKISPKTMEFDELQGSIDRLSTAITSLLLLFKKASEDIGSEHHHTTHEHLGDMNTHLENLNSKMEQLLKHNEEIAKGILVVAELIKEQRDEDKADKAIVYRTRPTPQYTPPQPSPTLPTPPSQF